MVIKYFGRAAAEPTVYAGGRWWLYSHPWLTEVGGVCRVIILGHVFEVYRRGPWKRDTTQDNYLS